MWKWIVGGFVLLIVMVSCANNAGGEPEPAPTVTVTATPEPVVVEPTVMAATAPEPTSSDRTRALKFANWLEALGNFDFPQAYVEDYGDDLEDSLTALAESYPGGTGDPVAQRLSQVAEDVGDGYDRLDWGGDRYAAQADEFFDSAAAELEGLYDVVRADALATEGQTGFRLTDNGLVDHTLGEASATIIRWIDGDTVLTSEGRVRLIGVDTPELSDKCSIAIEATEGAESLAPAGTSVVLGNPASVDDTDKYDRLLRYVLLPDGEDVGYSLLVNNLAEPRYDSTDGYDWHPREKAYHDAGAYVGDKALCGWEAAAATAGLVAVPDDDDDHHHRVALFLAAKRTITDAPDRFGKIRQSAKDQEEAAEAARRARASTPSTPKSSGSTSRSSSSSSSGSGSSYDGGYTGCRAYAPGGKTWKPIPCP
ncbi:hypothetical protein QQX10_10745 [Demequina sp. SYSU T00039]|uniref:TNase-like domain-containing protein n=1 Tax=Demequina lignilytica TaxID=3051663 RepID=A0AAW7M9K6_9MICO|nr:MULTISPECIES: hypothetical protein [unclassified Demequina]MDN4478667.1 hypothetical protein [Demequina sp. SYSU T00039-1]MDN4488645.1 hypothetical protein [Demequina sp. SYSU T00039]